MPSFAGRSSFMTNIRYYHGNFSGLLSPLVPVQPPSPRETHLWYVLPDEVKSSSLLKRYSEFLSACEKDNVESMQGDGLKKRALLARALVRTTIARYQTNSPVHPRSVKFKKNIYGKPEVEWQNDETSSQPLLQFNLSHTSSLIACGVTVNVSIGIDVEEKQRNIRHGILAFAKRYFSSDEVSFLAAITNLELQRQEFVKLWTLKEAYVKALGKGFSAVPFKTFTIRSKVVAEESDDLLKGSAITVESMDDHRHLDGNWQFALMELAGSHYAAICVEKDHSFGGENASMVVVLRKTVPCVEDEYVGEWTCS